MFDKIIVQVLDNTMSEIIRLSFDDQKETGLWMDYVYSKKDAPVSEMPAWRRFFKEVYNIDSYNYGVLDDNKLIGAVSLYHIKSPLIGNMLVSSPFYGHGGFYADSEYVSKNLLDKIDELSEDLEVDYIELRLDKSLPGSYKQNTDFLEFDLKLPSSIDEVWKSCLSSNARQNIRKSQKSNIRFNSSGDSLNCYKLLSETIRDLGTPFHHKKYFELLYKHFKDNIYFSEVYLDNRLAAGAIVIHNGYSILTPLIGSLKIRRNTGVNYFQYWSIIEKCISDGIKRFEFGRSRKGTPHVNFKTKWGTNTVQLYYNYKTVKKGARYKSVSNPSPVFVIATIIWKKLPLWFTRSFGYLFARYIP